MAFTVTLVSSLSRWNVEGKWRDKTITMGKEGSVVMHYITIFPKVFCLSLLFNPTPCEGSLKQIDCKNPDVYLVGEDY